MRSGPFALGLLVLVALVATATSARADSVNGVDWCTASEQERPALDLITPLAPITPPAFVSEAPPARPLAPGPESLLCTRGSLSADCQAQDPANRPTPPSPVSFATPDLASTPAAELPDPDIHTASLPPGRIGGPRSGFARGLFRPPRV